MSFFQALTYFLREALLNLVRSWRISLLAILTIGVSLFLVGVFLLIGGNVQTLIAQWQGESRVLVYLEPGSDDRVVANLREAIEGAPGIDSVTLITPEKAAERFSEAFPSLADLLEGWGDEPLPASFELRFADGDVPGDDWIDGLRSHEAVQMVDDDRDWLDQLRTVVIVLRGLAATLGLALVITAVFTIASVIRLTAYLYHDEIAVMRLVGATEFFIRGPFYVEGLLQGLAGGSLSVLGLLASHRLVVNSESAGLVIDVLAAEFLDPSEIGALVLAGGLAGLLGAVLSLRRESLGQTAEVSRWSAVES